MPLEWACADDDAAAAEIDIATIVTMVDAIWAPMTAAVPNGMGAPKPDALRSARGRGDTAAPVDGPL